jgi:hypothetical protein
MNLGIILGILKAGLDAWNTSQANKYRDRVIELEKEYFNELAKPYEDRSQLYLDERLLELETIARSFIAHPKK